MRKKNLIFLVLSFLISANSDCTRGFFSTLSEVEKYARSLAEYVDAADNNWLDPDFSKYYKSLKPNIGHRLLLWMGLDKKIWHQNGFKKLLYKVIKQRELSGHIGAFIEKYVAANKDSIFIWTDLFGAFHSLVRDLGELKAQGVIDDSFKIVKKNTLLVFNGNVISHSPYSLETISLVLRLMEVNPDRVVYIKGYQEDRQEWHSFSFARELKVRITSSHEMIPLNKSITRFFNTLSLALYVPHIDNKQVDVVLIANNEQADAGFKEQEFAGFLAQEQTKNKLSLFKLSNKQLSDEQVRIKAIISGEDRSISYRKTDGLTMLGTKRGATGWLTFSSPTSRNRRLYEFFYDAFVELTTHEGLENWTLTLINQDVRDLLGFNRTMAYNLITGQRITKKSIAMPMIEPKQNKNNQVLDQPEGAPPSDHQSISNDNKEEVIIGSTLDLSKSASTIGNPLKEGYDLAFAKVAREGGVGAFLPRIMIYDDEFTPKITEELLNNFLKKKVDIFLGPTGSAGLQQVYLPHIKKGDILLLFPYSGASFLRQPDLKNLMHYRIGYADEGRILAEYALDTLKAQKIAIFYQNDLFGKGPLEGALEVFKQRGFKNVLQVPYERNDLLFEQQATLIKEDDPDTIFFFAVTPPARSLIRLLGVQFLKGKSLIGMSVYDESFDRLLEEMGLEFLMVRVVPDPKESDIEIVKEYQEEAKRANHTPNLTSLEAYINANILFDVLKEIKPPLTKEKIIKKLESRKQYPFKGLILNYNPAMRELGRRLWLDKGKGPWIEKMIRGDTGTSDMPQKVEPALLLEESKKKNKITQKNGNNLSKGQDIALGSTMDLSRSASPIGKKVKEGLSLRFDQERKNPTLPDIMPRLFSQDDQYTPKVTRNEIEKMIESLGVTMIIGSQGSASLESYLDWIKEGKVLVMFPFTGSSIFRKPDLTNLVHFRGSYINEGEELVKYALENLGARKIVIFYQNDSFGKGPLEGARKALKKAGVVDFVEVPHGRNTIDFSKQIESIKKANPDTILFSTNAIPIRGLIQQMGVDFFAKKNLLGVSVYEDAFEQFLKDKGLHFIIIRMVPDPNKSNLEIAKEYRAAADAAGLSYDKVAFEQYINASILFDVLKKIKGPVTKQKLIQAFENIKNYDFKGLKLDFNPETRELSPVLWIDNGEKEWIERKAR